jgi:UDP-2,4-diacetamido-2,4,6-trideoxy-beta-L-altropyranose hydrolase
MTQVLISAMADGQIGTGHLRRMLTLAQELASRPQVVPLLHTTVLGARIVAQTAPQLTVLPPVAHAEPASVAADLVGCLRRHPSEILVLDNYFWTAATEAPLRPLCQRLCCVDDLANRPHLADLLLDQNANRQPGDYAPWLPPGCQQAIGPAFCLISAPFRALRHAGIPTAETRAGRNRVFVSLGGGDPHRDLLRLVRVILTGTDLQVSLATGSHVADAEGLRALAARFPDRVELVFDSPRVAEQMNAAGFAIAAGGTMSWERAVLGLPGLCLIVADNQAEAVHWLAARGVHRAFDLRGAWQEADLLAALQSYSADRVSRIAHARLASALITGDGVVAAADAILGRGPAVSEPARR